MSQGAKKAMPASKTMPISSQVQEKMRMSTRAQRRAMMEPMPSQTSATASVPYISIAGSMARESAGMPVDRSAICCPENISGTNIPLTAPSMMVKTPNTANPVRRSLKAETAGEGREGSMGSRMWSASNPIAPAQASVWTGTRRQAAVERPGDRRARHERRYQ